MKPRALSPLVSLSLLAAASAALAQPVTVTHREGLLSINCTAAPLADVFAAIEREAGVELTLEDEVKSKQLTADLVDVPVSMAVQQLLEGAGVNFVVMMDPTDWARVGRIYVGAGGGGPARSSQPLPRGPVYEPEPVEPMEEEFYDDQEALEALEALEQMSDELMEDPDAMNMEMDPDQLGPDEFGDEFGTEAFPANPPGSSPVPSYLPPAPSFPRSRFTPGLPGNSQPQQAPVQQQPGTEPPPATYPFTDPFGRPIPVPPDVNDPDAEQQQQQQQQQRQRPPQ